MVNVTCELGWNKVNYETDYKGKDRVIDPNLGFPSSRDKHLLYDLGHKNKKRSLHKN